MPLISGPRLFWKRSDEARPKALKGTRRQWESNVENEEKWINPQRRLLPLSHHCTFLEENE